jgi:ankyrin repeat protein
VDENASITKTSTTPTVEELMKNIEKLNSELSKINVKDKKDKKNGSVSDDDDSPYEEEASNKAKRDKKKHDKSYNTMSFNYNHMSSFMAYTSVPIGKTPYFDGTNYNQWKHCMKRYLYSISPEV